MLSLKQSIRRNTLALREQLSLSTRLAQSTCITERILHLPAYQQANTVLAYMNFGSEFASELWVTRALAEGKRVVLPRVNRHTNVLDLYVVSDLESQLQAGLWGIREPVVERCERLNKLNEVEFALVPGVAFCKNGARLGYGGGYYDKLLARFTHRPALVSAAFSLQIVTELPQEPTDLNVEWIVTEQEVVACSR